MYYQHKQPKKQPERIILDNLPTAMVLISITFFSLCAYSFHLEDKEHMEKCLERESSSYCFKTIYGWLTTKNFYIPYVR